MLAGKSEFVLFHRPRLWPVWSMLRNLTTVFLLTFLLNSTVSLGALYVPLHVNFIYSKTKNITVPLIILKENSAFMRHYESAWRWGIIHTREAVYRSWFPFFTCHSALPATTLLMWHKDCKMYHSMFRKLYSHTLPVPHPWYQDESSALAETGNGRHRKQSQKPGLRELVVWRGNQKSRQS